MTITLVFVLVAALALGISVAGYIQYKEQQKAKRLRQIAQLRYRASNVQDLADVMSQLPFKPEDWRFLLEYVIVQLKAITRIDKVMGVERSLEYAQQQLQHPTESPFQWPTDLEQLLVLQNKLAAVYKKLKEKQSLADLNKAQLSKAMQQANFRFREAEARRSITQARQALEQEKAILCQQHLKQAQQRLMAQAQDERSKALLEEITPILQKAEEMQKEQAKKEEEKLQASPDFQPKKKW